jgi:hypothetical protein
VFFCEFFGTRERGQYGLDLERGACAGRGSSGSCKRAGGVRSCVGSGLSLDLTEGWSLFELGVFLVFSLA